MKTKTKKELYEDYDPDYFRSDRKAWNHKISSELAVVIVGKCNVLTAPGSLIKEHEDYYLPMLGQGHTLFMCENDPMVLENLRYAPTSDRVRLLDANIYDVAMDKSIFNGHRKLGFLDLDFCFSPRRLMEDHKIVSFLDSLAKGDTIRTSGFALRICCNQYTLHSSKEIDFLRDQVIETFRLNRWDVSHDHKSCTTSKGHAPSWSLLFVFGQRRYNGS